MRGSAASARHEPSIASVGDYVALMKPRVMSLVVFTALVGLMIAPGHIHPVIGLTALCASRSAPAPLARSIGASYGVTALLAGALMVAFAWRVRSEREGARAERAAQQLFAFSILYLSVLFAVLLVEGGLGGLVGRTG